MPTTLNFTHADSIAAHFSGLTTPTLDPLTAAMYAGFVSVAAVCVYEIAIKDIFINFATNKHPVLGNVTRGSFERINGRVKYRDIMDEYVPRFGDKYSAKFAKLIHKRSKEFLNLNGRDFISSYNNVVICRNEFVHAGRISVTATFSEMIRSYEDGKEVITCLNLAMTR